MGSFDKGRMKFREKYTSLAKKENNKTEISNEAYAIGELLEDLLITLNKLKNRR